MPDKYTVAASTAIPILLEEPAGTKPYHPPPSAASLARLSKLPPSSSSSSSSASSSSAAHPRPPVPVGGFLGSLGGGDERGDGARVRMVVEGKEDGVIAEEEEDELDMADEETSGSRPPLPPPSSSSYEWQPPAPSPKAIHRPPKYRQG